LLTCWSDNPNNYSFSNPSVGEGVNVDGLKYYVLYADIEYIDSHGVQMFYNAIIGVSQFKEHIIIMKHKVEQGHYE